jgi:hypothetical protein
MLQRILSYGVISGLIVGVCLFGTTLGMNGHHPPNSISMVIGYLIMLIALSAVFAGIKRHRDADLGGVIRFWPAFGMGVCISIIAGIFYVLAWEAAVAFTHIDFASGYANMMIEEQKAKGLSGDALAKFSAEMEQFKTDYANPLFRLPMTFVEIFPVGLLVSLVSAALLRNSRFLPARGG